MRKLLLCAITCLIVSLQLNAATYFLTTANQNAAQTLTNWNTTGTGGGTTHPSNFTTSGDIFIVSSGQAANFAANPNFGTGVILQINSGSTMNIGGNNTNFTMNGTIIFGSVNSTQVTMDGGGSGNTFILSAGATMKTVNINGIKGANCSLPANVSKKTVTLNNLANYEFNGTSAQQTLGMLTPVSTLTINNAAGVTLGATTTVTTLTIGNVTNNSIFDDGGFQITCTGTLNLTSGTFSLGGATSTTWPAFTTRNILAGTTVEYGSAVAQTVSVTPAYQNLTFSGAGTKTLASGTLSVGGNWSITGGTAALGTSGVTVAGNITSGNITSGSGTISVGGSWTNSGTFSYGTGTVNFTGTAQTIPSLTYNILTLSGSGTKTAGGNLTAATLNNTVGDILDMVGYTLTATTINNGSSTIKFNGASNGKAISSGTVEYYGTTQTVTAGTYNNLKLSNSSGTNSAGSNLVVNGSLTTVTGGTLDMSTYTLGGLLSSIVNDGTIKISNSSSTPIPTGKTWGGTINYMAAAPQTVSSGTYSNLTLSGSGAKTTTGVTVNNILSIEGTATATVAPSYGTPASLQYNTATSRIAGTEWVTPFNATGGIVISNNATITLNEDKVFGAVVSLTIGNNATLATGNFAITFGGNFIKNGTFNCGSSPITISNTAVNQNIDGFTTTGPVLVTKTSGTAQFTGNVTCNTLTLNAPGGTLALGSSLLTHNFNGDVIILAGTLDEGSSTKNVKGNLTNNGNHFGNGKTILTGGSTQHLITGTGQFGSIELNDIYGAIAGSDLSIGSLKITSGTFSGNSHTITLTDPGLAWNNSNLSFDYGTSTVKMQGSGAQQMFGSTFFNLEINNPAGVTLTTSDIITNQLKLTSGQLNLNGNILTMNSGAVIAGNGGNTLSNFNNSNSNYIVTGSGGYVKQYVASSDVLYPIGTVSSFTPATLNNSGGTPDNYSVYVVTSTANTLIQTGVVNKQWTVQEETPLLSNLIMSFQWNTSDEGGLFAGKTLADVGILVNTNIDVVDHNLTIQGSNPRWVKMIQWQDMDFSGANARTYVVGNNDALPVELSSFTSMVNGRNINLSWETKTEKNSDIFTIERTKTGNAELNWESVGSVKAAVLSNSPKQYSFADKNLQAAKYQYRLKMIDNDGSFAYSKIVDAEVAVPKNFELSQNYPNPFNPTTKINYSLANDSKVSLEVYNIIGERVVQLVNEEQTAGYYTVNFGTSNSNITSGVYIYKLTAVDNSGNNFSSIKKMMLLK
jgi:hypothetical protein